MTIFRIFTFLLLLTLLNSCAGDEDNNNGPDMTAACNGEITFLENGVMQTLPLAGLSSEAKAVFQLKDPSPFDPQGVSRALAMRMQSGSILFDIVLEIGVEDSESCIQLGVYSDTTLSSGNGVLSFTYIKDGQSFIAGLGVGNGVLEITKCDFENKLISGKFSGVLEEGFGSSVINITEGTFEDICFFE